MLRVLIADDHAMFRAGLRRILEESLSPCEIGEASSAGEVLALLKKQTWSLLLLDISMPGRSGLDVVKDVKALHPRLPVLIVSMHSESQFATHALKAGADGYVTKDKATEELIRAIRKVLAGSRYVSPDFAERLADELASGRQGLPHESLSGRELEVLRWIAAGKAVSEIAAGLHLSVKTVSTYRTRILEKMRMSTNAELMHYAMQHGLI